MNPFSPGDWVSPVNPSTHASLWKADQRVQDSQGDKIRFQTDDWWHHSHWKMKVPGTITKAAEAGFVFDSQSNKEKIRCLKEFRAPYIDPKGDAGAAKCQLQLLPPEFLHRTADALNVGARKYGLWNWRGTRVNLTTYLGAILRHATAITAGEDLDESGLPHTAHIAASCAILIDAAKNGCLVDDRPKS